MPQCSIHSCSLSLAEYCHQIFSITKYLFSDLIPQQMKDSKECGVFLCQYAKCYSRNEDFLFELADMKTFRHRMKQELKYKTLFF